MDEKEIICKCSWFDNKRQRNGKNIEDNFSHTDMYYKELKDALWVFDSCDYKNGLARVEVIKVSKNTNEYDSAVNNSNISNSKVQNTKSSCQPNKVNFTEDDEEEKLYSWVCELREKYKKGILEEEYIKQLESIPLWKWEEEKEDCKFCFIQYPNQISKVEATCGQCGTSICGACDCDCVFSKELREKEDTIITNINCKICNNILPPHTLDTHKDITHQIHNCPHTLEK